MKPQPKPQARPQAAPNTQSLPDKPRWHTNLADDSRCPHLCKIDRTCAIALACRKRSVAREPANPGTGDAATSPSLTTFAAHIIAAGGKRLRRRSPSPPRTSVAEGDRHTRPAAACVEFIHTATLLHDDVVDASDLRRGAPAANAVWGNKSRCIGRRFFAFRAFQLMVADGSRMLKILSDASAIISAGEVHQLMVSHDLAITQTV